VGSYDDYIDRDSVCQTIYRYELGKPETFSPKRELRSAAGAGYTLSPMRMHHYGILFLIFEGN
jgi:hypothetical protein